MGAPIKGEDEENALSPDTEDQEIEYGKVYTFGLEEKGGYRAQKFPPDIWPNWSEGVPTKLRMTFFTAAFFAGNVFHRSRPHQETVELRWAKMQMLTALRKNYGLLPSIKRSSEWDGVYRIFSSERSIERLCGNDPTGTLYLGRAGSERGWSILRTRIMQIIKKEHHAVQHWRHSRLIEEKFPWNSLAIQWAYTKKRVNYDGRTASGATIAEGWLLRCYKDSYGEYPPLNEKG